MERKCPRTCLIKRELYRFQTKLESAITVNPQTAAKIYEYLDDLGEI